MPSTVRPANRSFRFNAELAQDRLVIVDLPFLDELVVLHARDRADHAPQPPAGCRGLPKGTQPARPIEQWHGLIGDTTLADAILDRLVHIAYHIPLKGDSMHKRQNRLTDSEGTSR